jgi:hypothetical protein
MLRFLGALAKLQEETFCFVMSVYPSVRPSSWNNIALTGRVFMKFDIWVFFTNLLKYFKFLYYRTRTKGTLHEDQYTFLIISRSVHLRMRNVSDKVVQKIKTYVLFSRTCFRKSCRILNSVEKYCRAGQATDDNTSHAHWILGTEVYKYTLRICDNYWFSTAIMVTRTILNVQCLSCFQVVYIQISTPAAC